MAFFVANIKKISDCVHPCPCGTFSDLQKLCTCAPALVTKYQKRISGPLLDRIDIPIEVPRVDDEKLSSERVEESGTTIRARVQTARFQLISERKLLKSKKTLWTSASRHSAYYTCVVKCWPRPPSAPNQPGLRKLAVKRSYADPV